MFEDANNDDAYLKAYAKSLDIIFEKILLPDNKDVTTNISRKENKDESFKDDKDKMSDV